MKRNILVFPCGSEIGLDIYSSVRYSTHFHLIGGSSVDDHGRYVYEDYIPNIPFVNSKDFIPTISRIVKERHIDAIYPAMDIAISEFKKHEDELGCRVVASPVETTQICLSKETTYIKLKDYIRTPKVYHPEKIDKSSFPVFAKPIVGYGAKGTKMLNSQDEVDSYIKERDDLLILEYLPGEEFTVDCFTNKEGKLLYSAARKRNRIKDGISVNTYFVENQEEFKSIAEKINERIKFRGAWFYQVKRDKNEELCLLEIASRLGGSSLLSRAVGVNFALLSLFDIFEYDVSINKNEYYVELDRALENKYKTNIKFSVVYCDYDDCLILDKNKVNVDMIKFLYSCINRGKKIILLSKHDGDLRKELKNFRLDNLFDEVVHIKQGEDKANYIKFKDSVFIDDSNAERVNIKNKLNIPVFSPEMIDVIL